MRNIKLIIEYDGARYNGWQRLGDSDKTIQGKIEKALSKIVGEEIQIIGSGRTDAGTHARGQVANFHTNSQLSSIEIRDYLNRFLPQDIVVKEAIEVAERFHARYNAKNKQYSYYIWYSDVPSAFHRQYSFPVTEKLDFEKLEKAMEKLQGKHDFIGFSALKKSKKSTVRTIHSIQLKREGNLLHFIFNGDGFLYKQIRIMMGTLIAIASGKLKLEVIDEIFAHQVRAQAGETVPSKGLFLDEVFY